MISGRSRRQRDPEAGVRRATPFELPPLTRDGRKYNQRTGLAMGTFSGTGLPPVARVGNSADAIQAIRRDTSLVNLPVRLVRALVVRAPAPPTNSPIEFAPRRR